jgi:hypothetical protein
VASPAGSLQRKANTEKGSSKEQRDHLPEVADLIKHEMSIYNYTLTGMEKQTDKIKFP